jgi:hypothetical protein
MEKLRARFIIEVIVAIAFLWWAVPRAADFGSCLGGYCDAEKLVVRSVAEENINIRAGQDKIRAAQQRGKVLDAVMAHQ